MLLITLREVKLYWLEVERFIHGHQRGRDMD